MCFRNADWQTWTWKHWIKIKWAYVKTNRCASVLLFTCAGWWRISVVEKKGVFYLRTCTGFWERRAKSQSQQRIDDTVLVMCVHSLLVFVVYLAHPPLLLNTPPHRNGLQLSDQHGTTKTSINKFKAQHQQHTFLFKLMSDKKSVSDTVNLRIL